MDVPGKGWYAPVHATVVHHVRMMEMSGMMRMKIDIESRY